MPTQWGENIVISELSDEPELSEEFALIFSTLKEVQAGKGPHVVLSFRGVTHLNSSHIAAMLRMRKRLIELGRQLVLCAMSDHVWSVMLLSGLDKVFRYTPDTSTALASLQIEDEEGGEG
jgi:anti-anti-sigma factor